MVRSRRPELEKDNPVAPQPYIGPRRRRALSRTASSPAAARSGMAETLQTLTEAAERFVNRLPRSKKLEAERNALLDACQFGVERSGEQCSLPDKHGMSIQAGQYSDG